MKKLISIQQPNNLAALLGVKQNEINHLSSGSEALNSDENGIFELVYMAALCVTHGVEVLKAHVVHEFVVISVETSTPKEQLDFLIGALQFSSSLAIYCGDSLIDPVISDWASYGKCSFLYGLYYTLGSTLMIGKKLGMWGTLSLMGKSLKEAIFSIFRTD